MTDTDLHWLTSARPAPIALETHTTAVARRRLLEHAARAPRRTALRRVSTVAIAASAAAAVLLVFLSPPAPAPPQPTTVAVAPAVRTAPSPLLRLADYIRAGATAAGDATLVLRTQTYPSGPPITGADLYTDSGKYFYAATQAGLPAAVKAGDNVGNGFMQRELAAAKLAANGNVQTARTEMANAAYTPGQKLRSDPAAVKQKLEAVMRSTTDPRLKQHLRHDLALLAQGRPLISRRAQQDNMVWVNSLDTLVAGATDPQVRAGVLRLLATMSETRVTRATVDGQPALDVVATAPALPAGYQEELIVNATTGLPIRFIGGTIGKAPGVTVTYRVSRVTVADIATGRFEAAGQAGQPG